MTQSRSAPAQTDPPITRADLMSWAKVAAIVVPILVAIVSAAIKLSSDANAIRHDVDVLQVAVADHTRIIDGLRDVGPSLARMSDQLGKVATAADAMRVQQVTLEERARAQDQRVTQFWSLTWPAMEARLKRIEDKLDRGR
jgi:hypothetical protein